MAYVGRTDYGADGALIRAYAYSAHLPDGRRSLALPFQPPAPLHDGVRLDRIAGDKLSRILNGILYHYTTLKLGSVIWSLWNGSSSTLEHAGALYGAAFETLRDAYLANDKTSPTRLLPKPDWRKIAKRIQSTLDAAFDDGGLAKDSDEYRRLKSGLENLNRAPLSMLGERFLSSLGVCIGEIERAGLQARNEAAHGAIYEEWEHDTAVRNVYALMTLANRAVLAATQGADIYIDYSGHGDSVDGFPQRKLFECQSGPDPGRGL
jgi:hypothetical protein